VNIVFFSFAGKLAHNHSAFKWASVFLGVWWGLFVLAVAPARAQLKTESPLADIALNQAPDRQAKLMEGAKKEGTFTLYSSMPVPDINALTEVFYKRYGVKAVVWRAGSEEVLQRTVTEARGGRFEVDIVENSVPSMEALRREKLLQQVLSPVQAQIMPEAVPAHKEWVGSTFDAFVQGYNTNLIKKEDLPKSYQDLLDPKWKGQLGIEAEDQSWFAVLTQELGQDKGEKLFRSIVDTNGISVRKGHTLLANLVASGEVPLALTLYNYAPEQLKQKGAPIDSFILSPAIAQFRAVGVLKKSPHPNAAVLWYDFMLGEEAQQILTKRFNYPTNIKINSPVKNQQFKFINPQDFLDMNLKWSKTYEQLVTKRAGK